MEQLTGLDSTFLNMETPTTYGHICGLAIYDPSTAQHPITRDDVMHLISERLHLLPPYRRRLIEVPLGLDHPYWIEDPDFDIDFHVRHIGLPAPGDHHQLAEQVARIAARHLDRSKPLWELYIIDGLEGGLSAQLTKIHHCTIDGVSGAEILATLLDLAPEPEPVEPPAKPWRPDPVPTQVEMLARSAWTLAGTPVRGIRLGREAFSNLPELTRSLGLGEMPGSSIINRLTGHKPDPLLSEATTPAPRTVFNDRISRHRRFAFGSLSLDRVKAIKTHFDVTVNDVVMAISSAALRRYLSDRGELPKTSLVAMVPVSVRTAEQQGTMGNHVAAMSASLHTDIADPGERLRAVHETMHIAKEQHAALPATIQQDFAQFAPPAVAGLAARVAARAAVAHIVDVPFNVVISNVPGPQFPLYCVGAQLVAHYPVSAINDGVGLNMTVQSYNGRLDFGLIGCREMVPDLWDLIDHLGDALDELDAATKAATKTKKTKSAKSKKAKNARKARARG